MNRSFFSLPSFVETGKVYGMSVRNGLQIKKTFYCYYCSLRFEILTHLNNFNTFSIHLRLTMQLMSNIIVKKATLTESETNVITCHSLLVCN